MMKRVMVAVTMALVLAGPVPVASADPAFTPSCSLAFASATASVGESVPFSGSWILPSTLEYYFLTRIDAGAYRTISGLADSGYFPEETELPVSMLISQFSGGAQQTGTFTVAVGSQVDGAWAILCSTSVTVTDSTYQTDGYVAPVDGGGVVNTVKGGATVPLKFRVRDGSGAIVTDLAAVSSFKINTYTCGTGDVTDEIEVTLAGPTQLTFNAGSAQFVQLWQTPKGGGICYRATTTLADGQTLTALFKTR